MSKHLQARGGWILGWQGATWDEASRAKTPRKTPKYWQRPKKDTPLTRITVGPPSWNAQTTLDAPHFWYPHNSGCGSGPAGGMLPSDHPFPAKPIPPLARNAPGTAALPGNSCQRRPGRSGQLLRRCCQRWVGAPRAAGGSAIGSAIVPLAVASRTRGG